MRETLVRSAPYNRPLNVEQLNDATAYHTIEMPISLALNKKPADAGFVILGG
ncbi:MULTISPECIES: hypothetical protein [unclassified Microcoleus]|uniref:hypothetical protein n=1 Tax=unclassified Microcoleus TaxID=2642155 RepID=UPI002FD01B27